MGPMDLRRFFSWVSVVDEERPSIDTVQRSISAPFWLALVDTGRPRPIWPPPLARPRPDTTTYTNGRCEKHYAHEVQEKYGVGFRERRRIYRVNLSVLKQACWCFNPECNRVQRSYTVSQHKGKFNNSTCFLLAPLRHAEPSHDWLIIFLHRASTSERDACAMAYLHLRYVSSAAEEEEVEEEGGI